MKCPRCGTTFIGKTCPKCGYELTEYDEAIETLMQLTGVGKKRAEELYNAGFTDIEKISKVSDDKLANVRGIGKELAKKIIKDAKEIASESEETTEFVKICQVCGAIIPPGANKCPKCGTPVSEPGEVAAQGDQAEIEKIENMAICPFCGALISRNSQVCPVCGAEVKNVPLEEPRPMEDPMDVLKKFFGVSEIPEYHEEEENVDVRVCPNCGAIVVNRDVCPLCGTKVPPPEKINTEEEEITLSETLNICPNCGAIIPPEATVCPICGEQIKEEAEISLSALFPAKEPASSPQPEAQPEEISAEELMEIAEAVKTEDELQDIDMEKLISAIPAQEPEEISSEDLSEIEKSVNVPETAEPEKEFEPAPLPPPSEKPPEKPVEILSGADKLNNLIYSFGTREDILSFTPMLVSLLYMASIGFVSGAALSILTGTVNMFFFFMGALFAIEMYLTMRNYDRKERMAGVLTAALPLITLLPYQPALYITIVASGALIYLKSRYNYDYWIPFTAATMGFALHMSYLPHYTLMFVALFGIHLISRYSDINIPAPAGATAENPEQLVKDGITAFQNKNYYDAIYLLRRAMKYRENDVNVLNTLGLAYGRIGNTEMAMSIFKKVIEVDPKFKYAWNNLGNVHARQGNYDEAVKCYRKALEIDPNYDDALLNMGYVMIRRGSYNEAVKIANKIKATT